MKRKTSLSSLYLLLFLIILTGCQKSSLSFIDESELPYSEDFGVCSLVKTIDVQEIPSLLYKDDTIQYKKIEVLCNVNKVEIVANQDLTIDFEIDGNILSKHIRFIQVEEKQSEDVVNEEPEEEGTDDAVNEPKKPEIVENSPQTETPSVTTPEVQKPTETVKPSEPAKPIEPPKQNNGEYKRFMSSETISNAQSKANCVAYISQYNNFNGCRPIKDEQTTLIIGFEPY